MIIPTYLENHIKDCMEKRLTTMTICSSTSNDLLEVWYYGDLLKVPNEEQLYIVDTDFTPVRIVAKDPKSNEEIMIFDGTKHGYNNMFCDTYSEEQIENRPLKKLDIPISNLILELGYSIDYEDEKKDYDFNENGEVVLIDNTTMAWKDVIRNGFDYISLSYVTETGKHVQFVDFELA